jgi:hypothetical protein
MRSGSRWSSRSASVQPCASRFWYEASDSGKNSASRTHRFGLTGSPASAPGLRPLRTALNQLPRAGRPNRPTEDCRPRGYRSVVGGPPWRSERKSCCGGEAPGGAVPSPHRARSRSHNRSSNFRERTVLASARAAKARPSSVAVLHRAALASNRAMAACFLRICLRSSSASVMIQAPWGNACGVRFVPAEQRPDHAALIRPRPSQRNSATDGVCHLWRI